MDLVKGARCEAPVDGSEVQFTLCEHFAVMLDNCLI